MSESSAGSPGSKARPEFRNINVSQILHYRLPPAGMVSILHRVSGALLFLVGIPLVLWLFQLSLTSELSFERLRLVFGHWFVKLVLLALAWSFIHHLFAGIRYLVLDLHIGTGREQAQRSAYVVFAASVVVTVLAACKLFGVF